MTTRDQARRTLGRPADAGRDATTRDDGRPSLPERLVAAREAKGVDLYRAERDTKIRARYLAALEHGDYAELPGTVYTKGFLRNYAQYLGLNPDDILEQWRQERPSDKGQQAVVVPPRPITLPREGITISPNIFAIVLLVLVAVGVAAFLGSRLLPYLEPPTITVDHPATAIETVASTDTTYTFSGTANAAATIIITADGQQLDAFSADAAGHWTLRYEHLHLGTNYFEIKATNPDTRRESSMVQRQIIVPPVAQPTPGATPTIIVLAPEENASFPAGAIRVMGSTTGSTKVTITAAYQGAPSPAPSAGPSGSPKPGTTATPAPTPVRTPSPTPQPSKTPTPSGSSQPSPSASTGPAPLTVPVNADGSFDTTYTLPAGKWQLTITAANDQGLAQSAVRTVNVQYKGIQVVVRLKGGPAWLRVWRDGTVDNALSNKVYQSGATFTVTANQSVYIRTGIASNTWVTVNGVEYQLSKQAVSGSWRLFPGKPPQPSAD